MLVPVFVILLFLISTALPAVRLRSRSSGELRRDRQHTIAVRGVRHRRIRRRRWPARRRGVVAGRRAAAATHRRRRRVSDSTCPPACRCELRVHLAGFAAQVIDRRGRVAADHARRHAADRRRVRHARRHRRAQRGEPRVGHRIGDGRSPGRTSRRSAAHRSPTWSASCPA